VGATEGIRYPSAHSVTHTDVIALVRAGQLLAKPIDDRWQSGEGLVFLELGGGSPIQVDFEPSIELGRGYRNADISARLDNRRRGRRRSRPFLL